MLRTLLPALPLAGLLLACGSSSSDPAPLPDVNLRATPHGPNEVFVEWDPVADSSYVVLRDGAPISSPVSSPAWLDMNVLSGTSYHYAVEARGTNGSITATGAAIAETPSTSSRWLIEDAYPNGGVGESAVVTDAAGTLHVVFHDAHAGALVHGQDDGSGLVFEDVLRGERTGRIVDLALDPDGIPHVAFARGDDLVHAERTAAGSWSTTDLVDAVDPQSIAIAVDDAGDVHVVQHAGVDYVGLRYSSRVAGAWTHSTIPALGPTVGSVDLTIVDGSSVAVLYFAGEPGRESAWFSDRHNGIWSMHLVCSVDRHRGAIGGDAQVGLHLGLFVDGHVVVAEGGPSAWQFEAAGEAGQVPRSLDLTVSRFGDVHIALHGRAQDLVHMLRFDGVWTEEFVDADGNVGENASVAVAPDGRIDIVYNDVRGETVRHAQGY